MYRWTQNTRQLIFISLWLSSSCSVNTSGKGTYVFCFTHSVPAIHKELAGKQKTPQSLYFLINYVRSLSSFYFLYFISMTGQ